MDLVTGYGDSDSEGEYIDSTIIKGYEGKSSMNKNGNTVNKQQHTVVDFNKVVTGISNSTKILDPTTAAVSTSTTVAAKKRKKFDISILPIEIQHALTRGDTLKDSDDEDDGISTIKLIPPVNLISEVKKHNHGGSQQSNSCSLLSLLPNPKTKNNIEVDKRDIKTTTTSPPVKIPVPDKDCSHLYGIDDYDDYDGHGDKNKLETGRKVTSDLPTKQSKSTFSFGYTTTEEIRIDKTGVSVVVAAPSDSVESSDQNLHDITTNDGSTMRSNKSKSGVSPWFHSDSKRSNAEVEC